MKKISTFGPRFSVGLLFLILTLLTSLVGTVQAADTANSNFRLRPITLGLELGSSIDMSGYDLSTIDFDITCGYRSRAIQTLGLGTGIHRALGSRNTFVPVYLLLRTSFTSRPTLCFLHLKAGYNFNTINNSKTFGGTNASVGLGFNLSQSRNFSSHVVIAYGFRHFDSKENNPLETDNVSLAQVSFGINF